MRRIKAFYITALILSVFILYLYSAFYFKYEYHKKDTTSYYTLNSGWSYLSENTEVFTDTFPTSLPADKWSSATLYCTLPETILDSDVLSFYTGHYNVWIHVDDTLIYSNTAEHFSISRTTGHVSHTIKLSPSMAGKHFSIIYQSCYPKKTLLLSPITFGNSSDILYHLIVSRLPGFIICALTFAIGCIGLMCYFVFRKQIEDADSLLWLSLFALALSSWSGFETQMMVILLPYHLAFSWYTFVTLKLIPIPALMVIRHTYQVKHSYVCRPLIILSAMDIILSSALQYSGILDFKETIFFTHVIFFSAIIWIFFLSIKDLRRKLKPERPQTYTVKHLHLLFIFFLTITVILDFLSYYLLETADSAKFSRIALLVYILGLAIIIMQNSLDLQHVKEQETVLHEMASTDPLTKLKNRAAFEKDLSAIPKDEQPAFGVAMFDLNKLKYFNDVHGHSSGDYYIIICSEILQDIFCTYGTVYRIGGDEFCAVMKDVDIEAYTRLSSMISSRIENLHQTMFEGHMEVADGYAVFNAETDKSLLHTMERADKAMYAKKQAMKAAKAV